MLAQPQTGLVVAMGQVGTVGMIVSLSTAGATRQIET